MPPPSLAPPSSLAPPLSLDSVVEESPPEPSSDSSDGPPHPTAPSARTPLVATRAHRCQAVRPVFIVLTSRRAPSSDRSATRDRSEERRVGKEGRLGGAGWHDKRNQCEQPRGDTRQCDTARVA